MLSFVGRRSLKWVAIAGVTGIALAVVEIIFSAYIVYILSILGIGQIESGLNDFLPFGSEDLLLGLIFFLFIGVLRSFLHALKGMSAVTANELFVARLKLCCINNVVYGGSEYLGISKVSSFFSEIFSKAALFFYSVAHSVPLGVQGLGLFCFLMYMSVEYTLVGMVYLLMSGLVVFLIQRKVQSVVSPMASLNDVLHSNIARIVQNLFLIKVLRVQGEESSRFSNGLVDYVNRTLFANLLSLISEGLPSVFGIVMVVGFIVIQTEYAAVEDALFISYLYVFLRFVQVLAQLSSFLGMANINRPHFKEAYRYFCSISSADVKNWELSTNSIGVLSRDTGKGENEYSVSNCESIYHHSKAPEVRLESVEFAYQGASIPVIRGFGERIASGQQLAIVGSSGSGKSTLLSLITGVLEPTTGSVKIGGYSPAEYIHRNSPSIGYAGPDPFLFEGSIRENLMYGNSEEVDDKEIMSCLVKLNMSEWVERINGDLGLHINMGKAALSTGQQQRLSIARALLRKPKLLILDEISANLDVATELELANIINKLKGDVTVVVVSHRQGLIKHADIVVDLDAVNRSFVSSDLNVASC
ncbi:MAG: ABC transporter ATP-binding protein [Bacteroidetes bacterium]|nr:MAG: ABC transporter ATP-binding protein [Bacteroidota bacterium]